MAELKMLAIDLGASSGRAMIGEFDGKTMQVTEIHRFSNDTVCVGDRMYWDVLRLFFEIKTAINMAVKTGPIDAIGIDTWGVDFGLLNAHGFGSQLFLHIQLILTKQKLWKN